MAVSPDQGDGESHSETILSAAEAGFTRRSYGKAYAQYETVAEELLRSDKVPPEHGARVRRYFQLIRPRQSQP